MNEQELKEILQQLEEQGWRPLLCDTPVPVYDGRVPCGTPEMCPENYPEMSYLPTGLLSMHPEFIIPVKGDSMAGAGIAAGDYVRIVCDVPVSDGDIVMACIDGEYTLKTYFEDEQGQRWLLPQNEDYEPIALEGKYNVHIVGRAKGVIKSAPRLSTRECMKILRKTKERQQEPKVPTAEAVAHAMREVAPMVLVGRQWYAVYQAMVDRRVVREEEYDEFIAMVTEAVPEHECLPTVRELQRVALGSFTKPVKQWREDNAPVKGKRFKDYLSIAMKTLELLA